MKLYRHLVRIVARVSGRVLVGPSLCRDEEWISISINDTESVFKTVMALRFFPPVLRPLITWFLPWSWMCYYYLRRAKKRIVPIVEARRQQAATTSSSNPEIQDKHNDLLQWMIDSNDKAAADPALLAHLELMTTLASVHTTTMTATHALYDLCCHPEYLHPIRKEIREVVNAEGGLSKGNISKLRNLDSFLKESQRWSPPSMRESPVSLLCSTYLLGEWGRGGWDAGGGRRVGPLLICSPPIPALRPPTG